MFDLKRSDFGIWNLAKGIATPRQVGARNNISGVGGDKPRPYDSG